MSYFESLCEKEFLDNNLESLAESMSHENMRQVDLFLGRLQPLHKGHLFVISQMTNPVVAIVKGDKSSQDKAKNPFSAETQLKLAELCFPMNTRTIIVKSGFVPDIIQLLADNFGDKVVRVFCDEDRMPGYEGQIKRANTALEKKGLPPLTVSVVAFSRGEENVSATKVRKSLIDNDINTFSKLVPVKMQGLFNTLRQEILESL